MMDLIFGITECIRGPSAENEVESPYVPSTVIRSDQGIVNKVVQLIQTCERCGLAPQYRIRDAVDTLGWTQDIAKVILGKIEKVIQKGQKDLGCRFAQSY
ncbi:hypothetical protein PISL3812_00872 [Talaromyces islandicus]|uniref:Uncharacterized protein n=1 Tax=Talaromyces islandicus TaxID=28573 RepID=A0A0U1LMJ5_TALIS|nr:hypothetical protein PISL3812_00872 [Talaromyces islandicus]